MKRRVCGWHTTINRGLHHQFLNIDRFQFCGQSFGDVQSKFLPAAHRNAHCQHQQAALSVIENGAGPNFTPGIAGDQVLKSGGEWVGLGDPVFDVAAAQNLFTPAQAQREAIGFVAMASGRLFATRRDHFAAHKAHQQVGKLCWPLGVRQVRAT